MKIVKLLDDALLKEQREYREDHAPSHKIHPSGLGKCYRAQILKRKGEPESNPPDSRTLRVFKIGNMIHEMIQQYLDKEAVEVLIEEDDVKGYADIVESNCVTDIKSCHSRAFWWMNKEEYDIVTQKYNNWLQVAYYGLRLGKENIKIVVVSKDDMCINEYTQKTEDWRDDVEAELYTLRCWWVSGKLPPAEPRAYGGKECKYCPYSTLCKELEEK